MLLMHYYYYDTLFWFVIINRLDIMFKLKVFHSISFTFNRKVSISQFFFINFYFVSPSRFSSFVAFKCVLKELGDFAGQRELVAENLQSQVIQGMLLLSKNLRDERKKSLNDGAQLTQTLNLQISALDRAKKNYEKAFRDSEKAIENYQKADADFNLSRAEVS
jgi:hypothetical protein